MANRRGNKPATGTLLILVAVLTINPGCPGPADTTGPEFPPPEAVGNDNAVSDEPTDESNDNQQPPEVVDNTNENGPPDETVEGLKDTDGDGFSDDEEINAIPGTDPFDPTDNPDNVRDSDGDGCSDFDEINFIGFCDGNPNTPPMDVTPPDTMEGGTVTISGTALVGLNSVVDGDTNDPTNIIVNNDTVDTQQSLPNPCTLGGFLGNTSQGIDFTDVYGVQMAANQTATLFLANPDTNDFDLFLYDEAGNPLDASEGTGKAEIVTAPSNGTFLVEVFGFSVSEFGDPGGLYTLLIGKNTLGGAAASAYYRERLSSLDDFLEGEVVVKRRSQTGQVAQAKLSDDLGLELITGGENAGGFERMRITGLQRSAKAATAAAEGTLGLRRPSSVTITAVKKLRRRSDIVCAEPNYIRHAFATPNDEFFPAQWHYLQIGLPEAWDITTGRPEVIVAVIDTGVVLSHPDLQGQLVAGFDFISDPGNALDGDGIDSNPDDPGDQSLPGGFSTFHGTHVAGTIAARTNNSIGVAGVAWDVRIMPVRVLGKMGGLDTDIAQGIRYAAGLPNNSGTVPDRRADIINMSLGGPGSSAAEQVAISSARSTGVIVIVAAGNEQSNAAFFSPAGAEGVVTVSAVGLTRDLAPYSNFGDTVEVAAPGGNMAVDANADTLPDGVLSTIGDDGGGLYALSQGTSMASPHVAGVAALMKSVNPDLSPNDFDLLLAGTHPGTTIRITDDLGFPGRDDSFGFGLINAVGAVRAAEEIIGITSIQTPILRVLPRSLDFGSDLTSAVIEVTNSGVAALTVTNVISDSLWLAVSPMQGTVGMYTVTVNRSGLADGIYSGNIQFLSNGGNSTVSVRLIVGTIQATGGDIGTIFVLLVDPVTLEPVAQDNITAAQGYVFSLRDIEPGDYLLFAGTDMDDDGFLGDEGEAFGSYPTLLDPALLDANGNRSGLSFGVSFAINIQAPGSARDGHVDAPTRLQLRRLMTKSLP